jgi:hypothetical protein
MPSPRIDEHVGQIRKRCAIGNHTSEAHLTGSAPLDMCGIGAKAQRVGDGAHERDAWDVLRPMRLRRERVMDEADVEPRRIGRDVDDGVGGRCWMPVTQIVH